MRFLKISLGILFTGLFINLFASSSVSAQAVSSPPEVKLSTSFELYDPVTDDTINIFNYLSHLRESCGEADYAIFTSIVDDYDNGARWAAAMRGYADRNTLEPYGMNQFIFYTNATALGNYRNDYNFSFTSDGSAWNLNDNYNDTLQFRLYYYDGVVYCDSGRLTHNFGYIPNVADDSYSYPLFSNIDVYYPQDYDGVIIPDEAPQPKEPTVIAPNYEVTVQSDGKFKFSANQWFAFGAGFKLGDLDGTSTLTFCRIESFEDNACSGVLSVNDYYVAGLSYQGQLPDPGHYKFFVDNSDVSAPVPPFPEDLAPYKILDRRIVIYWDGFSILHLDTLGVNDQEEVRSDESVISNKFFDMINIPTFGLTDLVVLPLAFISNLDEMDCQPVTLPFPNNIGNLYLPCMTEDVYQPHFPTILTIYQTILTGIFSYYIALRMFGNIKELSNPRDDRIEVARL